MPTAFVRLDVDPASLPAVYTQAHRDGRFQLPPRLGGAQRGDVLRPSWHEAEQTGRLVAQRPAIQAIARAERRHFKAVSAEGEELPYWLDIDVVGSHGLGADFATGEGREVRDLLSRGPEVQARWGLTPDDAKTALRAWLSRPVVTPRSTLTAIFGDTSRAEQFVAWAAGLAPAWAGLRDQANQAGGLTFTGMVDPVVIAAGSNPGATAALLLQAIEARCLAAALSDRPKPRLIAPMYDGAVYALRRQPAPERLHAWAVAWRDRFSQPLGGGSYTAGVKVAVGTTWGAGDLVRLVV
jgi:hypothetical protein